MRLYNVTFDLNDTSKVLYPKIPYSAGNEENKTIERVCLADSIEHCIQAISSDNREIRNRAQFVIRTVFIDEDDANLYYPEELKERGYVPDALENQEYWYLLPIACTVEHAEILSFDCDFDLAWTCINIEDCRRIVCRYTDTIETEKYINVKNLYEDFMEWADSKKAYSAMDNIWEDLAELPWTQITRIKKVDYITV